MPTISLKNVSKPAPKWFRKFKRASMILLAAANTMIAGIGTSDPLLVTKLQMWFTTGAIAVFEALEIFLANGENYKEEKDDSQGT